MRDRDLGGEPGVRGDQLPVDGERATLAPLVQPREHERRHAARGDPLPLRLGDGLLDQLLDLEALVGRAAEQESRAAERPVCVRPRAAASAAVSTRAETGGPPSAA